MTQHASAPRLAVIGLGGTIAMKPGAKGAVPGLSAEDLLELLPPAVSGLVSRVENFRQLPGAHLSLEDLAQLAAHISHLVQVEAIDGIVVMQGTDTIEETVFALELLYPGAAPLVVTGAMRHAGLTSSDGAGNIAAALSVAGSSQARERGALVCFNDEIHCAMAVQKTAATNLAAFSSPGLGPIGHVIEGRAEFLLQARRWPVVTEDASRVEPAPVALLAASLGASPDLVETVAQLGYRGCVVQATGAGHLPATWVEPLTALVQQMPVILATRVSRGPILSSTYAFPGSEFDLINRGLLSAGYLCASKSRILLSMALGSGLDRDAISNLLSDGASCPNTLADQG